MSINTRKYIEKYLKIKDKNSNIIPFKFNSPQEKVYNAIKSQAEKGLPIRIIILKARQMGFSTLTEAIIFKETVTEFNVNSAIVAHVADATNNLYEMFKTYYRNLPEELQPQTIASNGKEMIFNTKDNEGLNSRIRCYTAESGTGIGRSGTINNLHISELSTWAEQKDTLLAILQCVPRTPNSMAIIESTANGYDEFKERWDMAVSGESDFIPVFCAWYELPEYRMTESVDMKLTPEEEKLKRLYNLDNEQLEWRRWCIRNNCGNDAERFKQEYPSCPEEAFLSTGNCIFDKELIISRLNELRDRIPLRRGRFKYDKKIIDRENAEITNIAWVDDGYGEITIVEEPCVETDKETGATKFKPYAIGGDTAGEGSDYFTAKVIDNITQKCVATYRKQREDDDLYADQMYCLGMYYNNAIVGIEVNFSIAATDELVKCKYPNLYIRESFDSIAKNYLKKYGFLTSSVTRPKIIADFKAMFREDPNIETDVETLREMLTFIKNSSGREEADEGKHDDLVMADCIAHFVSAQGDHTWNVKQKEKEISIVQKIIEDNFKNNEDKNKKVWYKW